MVLNDWQVTSRAKWWALLKAHPALRSTTDATSASSACLAPRILASGLKELFRPDRRGDALAPTEFGDALLPAQPFQDDADLLLGRKVSARAAVDSISGYDALRGLGRSRRDSKIAFQCCAVFDVCFELSHESENLIGQ
jgi:hypothetical protein